MSNIKHLMCTAINLVEGRDVSKQRDALNEVSFKKEYRTVRLDIGRQTGKTTAIAELATERDIVIAPTLAMLGVHKKLGTKAKVVASEMDFIKAARGRSDIDRIFVDEPLCSPVPDRLLYGIAGGDPTFILLGM